MTWLKAQMIKRDNLMPDDFEGEPTCNEIKYGEYVDVTDEPVSYLTFLWMLKHGSLCGDCWLETGDPRCLCEIRETK